MTKKQLIQRIEALIHLHEYCVDDCDLVCELTYLLEEDKEDKKHED